MTDKTQAEALRLAEHCETYITFQYDEQVAAELRRLHALAESQRAELVAAAARTAEEKMRADQMTEQHRMQCNIRKEIEEENQQLRGQYDAAASVVSELQAQLSAIGAGGVESLRERDDAEDEGDAADEWRRLALQFDEHRMLALWHLRRLVRTDDGYPEAKEAEQFLASPPLPGEAVLAQRIAALAATPAQEHATQLAGEPVAYLDLGAGGYLDIGTDLSDEQLSKLPKDRHMLVIGGTYGVDGYAAAPGQRQKESDAAQLLKKYRMLCLEIGRGDSYHIARIDAAIAAAPAQAQEAARDAERVEWAMNNMVVHRHSHAFAIHVLNRGGTGDLSDCRTYIDAARAAQGGAA